jgi:molybdate transport system substrate-binding protein
MRGLAALLALLLTFLAPAAGARAAEPEILVAAAANLVHAFREILPAAERELGIRTRLVLGSTGQLRQQIEQGAPYDVFFAADSASVEALRARGLVTGVQVYAFGALVLAWPVRGAPLAGLPALAAPGVRRVALANPAHAPYGVAARQALTAAGLWDRLGAKLVYGENVAQVLQFVRTGNVDAALLALAVATDPEIRYRPVDRSLYTPIAQAVGVVATTRHADAASRLVAYVVGPRGRAVMERFGYRAP